MSGLFSYCSVCFCLLFSFMSCFFLLPREFLRIFLLELFFVQSRGVDLSISRVGYIFSRCLDFRSVLRFQSFFELFQCVLFGKFSCFEISIVMLSFSLMLCFSEVATLTIGMVLLVAIAENFVAFLHFIDDALFEIVKFVISSRFSGLIDFILSFFGQI